MEKGVRIYYPYGSFRRSIYLPLLFTFKTEVKHYECANGIQLNELNYTTYHLRIQNIANLIDANTTDMSTLRESSTLEVEWTDFRVDPNYVLYYQNLAMNVVTGFIPLISLTALNYLVYKHLLKRRQRFNKLGK